MTTFRYNATIYVKGAATAKDAIEALQIALCDYEDMNPGGPEVRALIEEPVLSEKD